MFDYLVTDIETSGNRGTRALVLIHNCHADVLGVLVRIPEARDVEPGIQGRGNHHADDDHPHSWAIAETAQVSLQNRPASLHLKDAIIFNPLNTLVLVLELSMGGVSGVDG